MPKRNVIISIDDKHLGQVHQVAERLREAGMDVEHQLASSGVITGSIPDDENFDKLQDIEGVAHIEGETTYQIAPPESN